MDLLIFLIISLIFFFLGRYTISSKDIDTVKEKIKSFRTQYVGVLKRPTQEDLDKRTPEGKAKEEADKEMEKTLDKFL